MAIIEHLWVAEKATVTGTGSITLPGTPLATGDRTFVSAYASGDQLPYVIRDGTTGAQEAGIGTVSISSGVATLARTVVIESSNANAAVNFAGNSCSVWVDSVENDLYPFRVPAGDWATPLAVLTTNQTPRSGFLSTVWIPIHNAQYWSGMIQPLSGAPSAAMNARLGLYNPDRTDGSGGPGSLLIDTGTTAVASGGGISASFPSNMLIKPPGVWAVVGYDSVPSGLSVFSFYSNPSGYATKYPLLGGGFLPTEYNQAGQFFYSFWTFGALPASAASWMIGTGVANYTCLVAA